jgi:hypothetical protein
VEIFYELSPETIFDKKKQPRPFSSPLSEY